MKLSEILKVECTTYDFKESVEKKKTKSWLKSVSAFANTKGGSLFFGVDDDGNVVGLDDSQSDAEFISQEIKAHLDPLPDFELIPHKTEDKIVIEVKISEGRQTPYYYYLDGSRIAFIRSGNESIQAVQHQLLSLVLKGTNSTFDAQKSGTKRSDHSFTILANTFTSRSGQVFEEKMLESMGLVSSDGYLTQAGLLFSDSCNVYNSKLVCTRWAGLYKSDAINDHEYQGNLLLLLRAGVDFVNANTNKGWIKLPDRRKNLPDYAERAVLEAIVNHLIHRDYTIIGGEVHIDIFDDRIEFNSPGGMFDGTFIQNRDITKIPSMRRNPILADVFTHLDYMEKRGSGLNKICVLTSQLDGYEEDRHPEFHSESNVFYTTIRNVNYPPKDEIADAKVGSSDAKVGSSNPSKVGSSDANRGSSYRGSSKVNRGSSYRGSSYRLNHSLVDIYGDNKRVSKEELWKRVQTFCQGWHSSEDIVVFTGKTPKYIKEVVLPQMVKAGVLERLYPETPNHPKQKYRTKAND